LVETGEMGGKCSQKGKNGALFLRWRKPGDWVVIQSRALRFKKEPERRAFVIEGRLNAEGEDEKVSPPTCKTKKAGWTIGNKPEYSRRERRGKAEVKWRRILETESSGSSSLLREAGIQRGCHGGKRRGGKTGIPPQHSRKGCY